MEPTARLEVKVVPGASRTRVVGPYGNGVKVQVSAAPEKGRANEAVIAVLADALGIARASIELVSGQTQPRKVFAIAGLSQQELARRLGL